MNINEQLAAAADTLHTSSDVLDALNLRDLATELDAGTATVEEAQQRFHRRQRAHMNLATPTVISGGLGFSDPGYAVLQHASITRGVVTGTLDTGFMVGNPTEQATHLIVEGTDDGHFTDKQTVRDTIAALADLLDCWDALTPNA